MKLVMKVAFRPTINGQLSSSSQPTTCDLMLRADEPQSVKLVPATKPVIDRIRRKGSIVFLSGEGIVVMNLDSSDRRPERLFLLSVLMVE